MSDAPVATPPRNSRGLLIALIVIGALLLIGITAIVTVLVSGGLSSTDAAATGSNASATATPTPSATETPTPTPSATKAAAAPAPAPAPDTTLKINSFTTGSTAVTCDSSGTKKLSFSWSTSNASTVYFGVATADASTGGLYSDLPGTGTDANFGGPIMFHCSDGSTTYTLTVVATGAKVSKSVTVTSK